MCLTLARTPALREHKDSRGLSLFYVEMRDGAALNGIQMIRLKNKLGTRQVPTAELLLHGTKAELIADEGRGIPAIGQMLNITRMHNAVASVGAMRRMLQLARDYATKRTAFGKLLKDWPLHLVELGSLEVETRGCALLLLETTRLYGLGEAGEASESEEAFLRLLTPLLKLYTGKMAVPMISEALEAFGGQGYMEDTGIPCILRDAQVLPIWEGTTNILSLDALKCLAKSPSLAEYLSHWLTATRDMVQDVPELRRTAEHCITEVLAITCFLSEQGPEVVQMGAREVAVRLSRALIGTLLVRQAQSGHAADIIAAARWPRLHSRHLEHYSAKEAEENTVLVMDGL